MVWPAIISIVLQQGPRPLEDSPPGQQGTSHEDDEKSVVGESPHTQPDYL